MRMNNGLVKLTHFRGRSYRIISTLMLWSLMIVLLAGCGGAEKQTAVQPMGPEAASSESQAADAPVDAMQQPPSIEESWMSGAHAQTFVVSDDGTNMECTTCHAPYNYLPAMDEIPEGCKTCKFEVSDPDPFVAEEDWVHVDCQVCHQIKKKEVQPEVVFLEFAAANEYTEVSSTEELCLKCHQTEPSEGHAAVVVAGGHAGMTCTDCHDAHSAQTSCTDAGCHADVIGEEIEIPGHDSAHAKVGCVACHDGQGMTVGPVEEEDLWSTWLSEENGDPIRPFASHNLVLEASCDRCHFQDNPWGLTVDLNQEGG